MQSGPSATQPELEHVPLVLTHLVDALRLDLPASPERNRTTRLRLRDLHGEESAGTQIAHDYGDVCQAVTELALETNAGESERLAFLTHELRNLTNTAIAALELLKAENAAVAGVSGKRLHRSLLEIRALVGRSISQVAFTRQTHTVERFFVSPLIDELAPDAALSADAAQITLTMMPVDDGLAIEADRLVLKAVVMNLLHNAFKFTQPRTTVTLRVGASADRVLVEVHDACGGIADGNVERLFRPFERRGVNRTGAGLGLSFSRWAVEANDGRIYARDVPGAGCVFTVDLPRLPVSGVSAHSAMATT